MKKKFKGLMIFVCIIFAMSTVISNPLLVKAASTRKCYLIENKNITAYNNSGLTTYKGTIYGSDEIIVLSVTDRYSYVSYPTRSGRKNAYIPTSAILTRTSGSTYTARARITTYRRPGGWTYGYISRGDQVKVLGTYGNYTQVKYPVSGGYKYGFVTTSNADAYIKNSGSNSNYSSISNGIYKIATALNNNYVLDVNNYATFNGGNVEIYPYHDTNNEKWNIISLGNGYYRIVDCNSGKSLDVSGGSSASGTNVQIWETNNTNAQKWRFVNAGNGYYYIINANGCYLDVQNGTVQNGNNVWVYTGNQTNAQKWKLTRVSSGNSNTKVNLSYGLYKSNSAYISCGFDGYVNTAGRHEGIDIKYAMGKPVYALTDGVVTRVTFGYNGRNGLSTIAVYNSSSNKTVIYLHSAPSSYIRVGQTISKGQQIATESWRGISSSSASHTHVEVRNGRQTSACKSVNDYRLENSNPTSFWNSQGYNIK